MLENRPKDALDSLFETVTVTIETLEIACTALSAFSARTVLFAHTDQ